MNGSSKNGTLAPPPPPPEMGIGSKYVSEYFKELSFSNFQAFLRRGCTSFNPFLSNLDNSPHLTAPKVPFLLDPFTFSNEIVHTASFREDVKLLVPGYLV